MAMAGKGRILVVDDDRLVLATLVHGLTQAGYDVIDADNGDDAILLAREHRPDLALLDIRMEGKSGFDVAAYLREYLRTPFMFLSAFADPQTIRQVEALGAVAYLVKPLDIGQILPTVANALAQVRERQSASEAAHAAHSADGAQRAAAPPTPPAPSAAPLPPVPADPPSGFVGTRAGVQPVPTAPAPVASQAQASQHSVLAAPAARTDPAAPAPDGPTAAAAHGAQPAPDRALDTVSLAVGVLMHRYSLQRDAARQRLMRMAADEGRALDDQALRLVEAVELLARGQHDH